MNRLLRLALAPLLASLLAACCPAPLAATDPPEGVLVGVVVATDDGAAHPGVSWVAGDDGARVAVRPPLEQPPGTVVYLRGRWRDGAFEATEASTVHGGS